MSNPFTLPYDARRAALAGRATITLLSLRTSTKFTYNIWGKNPQGPFFVAVHTSAKKTKFIGTLFYPKGVFRHGKKSSLSPDDPRVRAFQWVWRHLLDGKMPPEAEVWGDGRCARCKRELTDPESVARGLGPECAGR